MVFFTAWWQYWAAQQNGPVLCSAKDARCSPTPPLVFQMLKSFHVETQEKEDVQMAYRFVLMPRSSPLLTFSHSIEKISCHILVNHGGFCLPLFLPDMFYLQLQL